MNNEEAKVTVFRFDSMVDKEPRYETFSVPGEVWHNHKVIDVIRYIYENHAPGIAFREPCVTGVCGSCTVRVNKKPVLACSTLAEKEMLIEPVDQNRVIKDLVVKM